MTKEEEIARLIATVGLLDARMKQLESAGATKPDEPQSLKERLQADRAELKAQTSDDRYFGAEAGKAVPANPRRAEEIKARHSVLHPPAIAKKDTAKDLTNNFKLKFYCYHEGVFSEITLLATGPPVPVED